MTEFYGNYWVGIIGIILSWILVIESCPWDAGLESGWWVYILYNSHKI